MSSFLEYLDSWNDFDFIDFFKQKYDIKSITSKNQITEIDFLKLLTPTSAKNIEDIATKANRITINEFGKTIQIYTPLYLSNYCSNKCLYCGFNLDNKIDRVKLTDSEILLEGQRLKSLGINHILLLTGGDRINTPLTYIQNAVKLLRPIFNSISIEVYSMNEVEYKTLTDLGVENVTLYQETYDEIIYKKVHLSGEKKSYSFRIDAIENAAKAGINSVNLGVLLGLSNPIIDFFKLGLHCQYIQNKYPACNISISLPRIKDANVNFINFNSVSNSELVQMITAFRLFMPKAGISISTRESKTLRDKLLPLGVTKMSAQSKTSVGVENSPQSEKQFEISDTRTVMELDKDLISLGYQPVYKDWVTL